MIMSTLLDFKRSPPGVWKLGQENHVGGTFLFARLRCIAVDAKRGLCVLLAPGCNQTVMMMMVMMMMNYAQ